MPQGAVQLSCEQCKKRKTKCDKGSPCSACKVGNLICTPVQRARLPRGKTGKIKGKNAALEDRLARLESLVGRLETQLQSDAAGDKANDLPSTANNLATSTKPVQYASKIENFVARDFWMALSNEVSGLRETLEAPDEDDITQAEQPTSVDLQPDSNSSGSFLLNQSHTAGNDMTVIQPSPANRSILLQIYHDRVDCLFKVLHWPTVCSELERLWANNHSTFTATETRLLEYAIYFLAVCSLSQDDCDRLQLGDRTSLMSSFQAATELFLGKSGLLTTTRLIVLQAFVLYLAGLRCSGGAASTWTLLALAVRIADACGLPESSNASSAFDKEMGRRVWFSIGLLDSQTSFGRGSEPLLTYDNIKLPPANINDSEMSSQFIPTESASSFTDMSFSSLTHQAMMCQRRLIDPNFGSWRDKVDTVVAFELCVNQRFGQFEFSNEPLQKYTAFGARDMAASMHLLIRRPPYQNSGPVPPDDKYDVLDGACRVLQSGLFKQSCVDFACFSWFSWPKWYALAVVLVELCSLRQGSIFDRAYNVAQQSYAGYAQSASDANSGILWKPITKLMRQVEKLKEISSSERSGDIHHIKTRSMVAPRSPNIPPDGPVSINVNASGGLPRAFADEVPMFNSDTFDASHATPWYEWDIFLNEIPSWNTF